MIFKRHGRVHDQLEWCQPRIVTNALELLDRELKSKRALPPCVHLCLSTDPFMMGYPEIQTMSLAIVERLNRSRIPCSLLTKGLLPQELADRERFSCENTHGISLVSLDEDFRRKWEPGASPYIERIAALRRLHDAGCRTLVHMEPYPTPNILAQDILAILQAVTFVDEVFFSRWNYNRHIDEFRAGRAFYRDQSSIVHEFCAQHGMDCDVT
jgi:DNA repair photolyase